MYVWFMRRWILVVSFGGLWAGCGELDVGSTALSIEEGPDSVVITNTVSQDEEQRYTVALPADATFVVVSLEGDGDADLYTGLDREPTVDEYDCRPFLNGTDEMCLHIQPGDSLGLMVRGWDTVSSYQLSVSWRPTDGVGTSP
jgi:hypothetical protein